MDYKELERRISKMTVMNIQGEEVQIAPLWAHRRIVLTFLRHFG
jgi:hypothetical protein